MMQHVTPSEAISLMEHLTIEPMYQGRDIYAAVYNAEMAADPNDPRWAKFSSLGAVFNAGRVQGIREERAKRRRQA